MHDNIFSPKVQEVNADALSTFFFQGAQIVLIVVLGLLPFFFVPQLSVSLGFMKAMFVSAGVYIALILACLAILRRGKLNIHFPLPVLFFWVFALSAVVSSLLSGDTLDSMFGNGFDIHSSSFFILLASVMTLSLVFVGSKGAVIRMLLVLGLSAILIYLFSILRLIFGPDFLSLGVFNSSFITPVGSLNDLALYAGLVLIVILVAIQRVPANVLTRSIIATLTVLSLILLAVVNFSFLWMIIGFLSLLTFLYLVAKDTWLLASDTLVNTPTPRFALGIVALICLVSGAFIVSGDYIGSQVSKVTGVSYLEVRPSFSATLEIAKSVYKDNALTGIGPNKFEDAWRMYKDPVINQTQFWSTDFNSGISYVVTVFINTGLMGMVFFLAFILTFLYTGFRLFFTPKSIDQNWNTVGLIVFSASTYLWIMTFFYTPGATILVLAALATGLTSAIAFTQVAKPTRMLNVSHSRQHGYILIALNLLVIVSATAGFITLNKHFFAQVSYTSALKSLASNSDLLAYDNALAEVSARVPGQDVYLFERAQVRLAELDRLNALTEPTNNDRQYFEQALVEGIQLSKDAITLDRTNPYNHALLGGFYGLLTEAQYEGVSELRHSAFAEARRFDPLNPQYDLIEARQVAQAGNMGQARGYLDEAIKLKNNYTDALFFLSQIDIQEGNATSAIATTQAIISIEPNNPTRRLQLGLLQIATGDLEGATQSLKNALILDPNYANARYILALTHLDLKQPELALEQLRIVAETNPDNADLKELIEQVESGNYTNSNISSTVPVKDDGGVEQTDDQTVSKEPPKTDLVSPVNRVPKESDDNDNTQATQSEISEVGSTAEIPQ